VTRHVAAPAAFATVAVPATSAGLVLGRDHERSPVIVRVFRPEPTRLALVGGWWAARLLVFRALAVGARAAVYTTLPDQWRGFGEAATGRPDRVVFAPPGGPPIGPPAGAPASAAQPLLHVYDVGPTGAPSRPALGAWQTQLTLLPQLTEQGVHILDEADLTVLQRLTEAEVAIASRPLRLNQQAVGHMPALPDDMLAILGGSTDRYLWIFQTPTEASLLGQPQR
jgi:hypothetical protein